MIILSSICYLANLVHYNPDNEYLFEAKDKPTIVYFDKTNNHDFRRNFHVFHQVLEYDFDAHFMFVNCTKYPSKCSSKRVDDFPQVQIFLNQHRHPAIFLNEHSKFALIDFVSKILKVSNPLGSSSLKILSKDNISYFNSLDACKITAFINSKSQQSIFFLPSIKQIAYIMKKSPRVQVGLFDCFNDIDECIRQGISTAPIIRIQNDDHFVTFNGTREIPYILDFLNKNCHTFYDEDGHINMTLL